MVRTWNLHVIRPSKNQNCPSGRPAIMYLAPNIYGTHSYLQNVEEAEIEICQEECEFREEYPCNRDVYELAHILIEEELREMPTDAHEAIRLYHYLRSKILEAL